MHDPRAPVAGERRETHSEETRRTCSPPLLARPTCFSLYVQYGRAVEGGGELGPEPPS